MTLRFLTKMACLTVAVVSLHSTSADAIFASVKSTGMAAACISYPIDTLAGAYNPAGMTDIGDRFDIEAGMVHADGSAHVKENLPHIGLNPVTLTPYRAESANGLYKGTHKSNAFPVDFGINKMWCLSTDWELATGLVVYNRNYQKTTYTKPIDLLGSTKPGVEYLHETISPIIAIKWCNSHTLGISVNYQIERLRVDGLENFDRPVIPGIPGGSVAPGHVTNRSYDYASGWGVTIGYHGQLTNDLSIGLTYQPKTTMSKMSKYKGFLAKGGRLDIPQKIGAGISYRFVPCFIAAFDVEYISWSQVKALHNTFLNDGVLEALGSKNGPGFGFRDQTFYRLGAEWTINECWTVRAGYRYAATPVRKSQTAVNVLLLDLAESFMTAGATWNVTETQEISILGAYGFEHKVDGKNSIPAFLGSGEANINESKFAIGLAWGWKY